LSAKLEQWFQVSRAVLAGRAALGLLAVLSVWRSGRPNCRVAISGAICQEVLLAVLAADCEPVFCDVDVANGLVPDSEWVRARNMGADVAIVAHLYGNPARTNQIRSIFPATQCLIIDDAAQALGSYNEDGLCGSFGDVGLLSFGPTKQISIGNGAILFRDLDFAARVEAHLLEAAAPPPQFRSELQKRFRSSLDAAREQLIATEVPDTGGFADLLRGMDSLLMVPLDQELIDAIFIATEKYPAEAAARREKAQLWQRLLDGSGAIPVGMATGCVPWRFVCRVPGISWRSQAALAGAIRKSAINVSTWYLPVNWFVGQRIGTLPGVEMLSREVFQFWLDAHETHESIAASARVIRRELEGFNECGTRL